MKNVMKLGMIEAAMFPSEDVLVRLGTFGVIGGGLLALASLMF